MSPLAPGKEESRVPIASVTRFSISGAETLAAEPASDLRPFSSALET